MEIVINTPEQFKTHIAILTNTVGYKHPLAFGLGIKRSKNDTTLDVHFPLINWNTAFGTAAMLRDISGYKAHTNGFADLNKSQLKQILGHFKPFYNEKEKHPNILLIEQLLNHHNKPKTYQKTKVIIYFLFDKDTAIENTEEAYFKLQCLSQLHVKPHGINLENVFGKLHNIAWTNYGPILPEDLDSERIKAMFRGEPMVVSHVDKFPYMVNYHLPKGVRIASGSQVRLGAHCAEGTTVMPAGYINFNAGTLGNAMIEGRISAGVVVGKNSDIGGGASIMGTLSGGNKNIISIGEQCLLGANSGTGISLGFGCTIAAGVYVTAGAKVRMYNADKKPINLQNKIVKEGENIVKGLDLNDKEKLLFLVDSKTGHLICLPNPKTITLNSSLHTA